MIGGIRIFRLRPLLSVSGTEFGKRRLNGASFLPASRNGTFQLGHGSVLHKCSSENQAYQSETECLTTALI